jgi:succinate dehydrogenase / fumarate reductase flavoprotein subunit
VLASGGYSNIFYLSTNAASCNVSASWRAYRRGALFANPAFTQIHPTCIPMSHEGQSKLTLMSESLRNHGRIWVPQQAGDQRPPGEIPEQERDYFLERMYPAYGNLSPRDISSRAVKSVCDEGRGVGAMGRSVYLDFAEAIGRLGVDAIEASYGNLFEIYHHITDEDPYQTPMRIYPAAHYTMGGLWVDYHLMSNLPGLFVVGEANFSDHGANRLGASALMQGLADGYFILPQTLGDYLAGHQPLGDGVTASAQQALAQSRVQSERLLALDGDRSIRSLHRELGEILWNHCGMSRTAEGLRQALELLQGLKQQFWQRGYVGGSGAELNQELEQAGRVADFIELGMLMCQDALRREESCGAHFREEYQRQGEAARDDAAFAHVSAWAFRGEEPPQEHREPLQFESVAVGERSYR